jgi:hypothetical protein
LKLDHALIDKLFLSKYLQYMKKITIGHYTCNCSRVLATSNGVVNKAAVDPARPPHRICNAPEWINHPVELAHICFFSFFVAAYLDISNTSVEQWKHKSKMVQQGKVQKTNHLAGIKFGLSRC